MALKISRNKSHSGKTKQARQAYAQSIRSLDYDPTADDNFKFAQSTDSDQDFSIAKSKKKRGKNLSEILSDHFKDNWVVWIVSIFGFAVIYFITDFNKDIGWIKSSLSSINKTLDRQDSNINKITDKIQKQELNTLKNNLKIEQFEKELKATKLK